MPRWFACAFAGLAVLGAADAFADPIDYLRDVKPLLARQCVACHGTHTQKHGLRLDTADALLRGGTSGQAVIPGKPAESRLLLVVEGHDAELPRMPYKRPPLDSEPTELLHRWIAEGAVHPAAEEPSSDQHWAFVAPVRPVPPPGATHPIDAWLRHSNPGPDVAPRADRATLIRRVTLDLTGLPPSPGETDGFESDGRPDAYERLVDRLLASPHLGERWGRWWLDGARYADSNGYSVDAPRSVWPYRDWVVRALNADLPFDTFTRWQIAGDLVAAADPALGTDPLVASGFHRNTQINHEGGVDAEQFRIESVIDRVNTTSAVWLGVTIGCAQCHDHKFDPFTQRDFYGMFAYFNSTENDGHAVPDYAATGPSIQLPAPGEAAAIATWQRELQRLEREVEAATGAEATRLKSDLAAHRKRRPGVAETLVMREATNARPTVVFVKGDFTRPGAPVVASTPESLPVRRVATGRPDRRELADWLVSAENPLTARVIVNRVWQVYFGRGLVETENDFGTMGTPPSHPELLDWLAVEFRAHGWSLRHLHRLIVTSEAYQAASATRPADLAADPRNHFLARQTRLRLDAEEIRDNALAIADLLDPRIGGPPVFPPQPEGLGAFTQNKREWKASTGGDRYRRALYTHLQRSTLHPAMAVFDAPDTFTTCTRRLRSDTPLQALTLLNDPAFHEIAIAFGARLAAAPGSDRERIALGCRRAFGRRPRAEETERLVALLGAERAAGSAGAGDSDAWLAVARVLLNLDATLTRE